MKTYVESEKREPIHECVRQVVKQQKQLDLNFALRMLLYSLKTGSSTVFHAMKPHVQDVPRGNDDEERIQTVSGLSNAITCANQSFVAYVTAIPHNSSCIPLTAQEQHRCAAVKQQAIGALLQSWQFCVDYDARGAQMGAALPDGAKLEFFFSILRNCMSCMDYYKQPHESWQQVAVAADTNCRKKMSEGNGKMADDLTKEPHHMPPEFFARAVADGDVMGTLSLFAHGQQNIELSLLTGQRFRLSPGVHRSAQKQAYYQREIDTMYTYALSIRSEELRFATIPHLRGAIGFDYVQSWGNDATWQALSDFLQYPAVVEGLRNAPHVKNLLWDFTYAVSAVNQTGKMNHCATYSVPGAH